MSLLVVASVHLGLKRKRPHPRLWPEKHTHVVARLPDTHMRWDADPTADASNLGSNMEPLLLSPSVLGSVTAVKSGLKHGGIIPAHCRLLHQDHALLQTHPPKRTQALATCLIVASSLVMILYKDFGAED